MNILNLQNIRLAWDTNDIDKKLRFQFVRKKNPFDIKKTCRVYVKLRNPDELYFNDLLITPITWRVLHEKSNIKENNEEIENIYKKNAYFLIATAILEIVAGIKKVTMSQDGLMKFRVLNTSNDDIITIITRALKITNVSYEKIKYIKIYT